MKTTHYNNTILSNKKTYKGIPVRIPIAYIVLIIFGLYLSFPHNSYGVTPSNKVKATQGHSEDQRFITIDFDNVDILLFIKYISELTGKNFVVDKAVRGNVTIISPTKISEEDAYRVFESVLQVHGFTTVSAGAVTKIVPIVKARSEGIETLIDQAKQMPEDRMVTQLIPLKYSSPDEIKKTLAPLLSKASVMIAHTQSGMLIVTETLSNLNRLLDIIKAIDVPNKEEQITVIPLKNGSADAAGKVITTIFQKGAASKGAGGLHGFVRIVPYERINSLIVLASDADVRRIKHLVKLLDTKSDKNEGDIHVFYLQNANAKELAKVLNTIPESSVTTEDKGKRSSTKNSKILADEETNSLIVIASASEYNVIEDVIKKLDIPRRMVFLETLIMEVDTTKDFQVGAQWVAGGTFSEKTGTIVTGFSGNASKPYDMINGINSTKPSLSAGASFGVLKEGIKIGGVTFPSIASIINAYKNDSDINIISTPQVLTTDNKKAEISVGENVPYITSKNTTSGTQQDYTNYEYKDVSTKLTITPHINQSNVLRLEINTEVIKLKDNTASLTPTTLKRTADTTVILQDGETVVIGGIIGHDKTDGEYKVPLLGDIPILGWLFKTHSTNTKKTNMFIFVTPHIIKNPGDISRVTNQKKMDSGQDIHKIQEKLTGLSYKTRSLKLSELGYDMLQQNKISDAKGYLLDSLQIDPENPYALINIAVIYEKQGEIQKAIDAYRRVILSGSGKVANGSSDPGKVGKTLVQIAKQSLKRLHVEVPEIRNNGGKKEERQEETDIPGNNP